MYRPVGNFCKHQHMSELCLISQHPSSVLCILSGHVTNGSSVSCDDTGQQLAFLWSTRHCAVQVWACSQPDVPVMLEAHCMIVDNIVFSHNQCVNVLCRSGPTVNLMHWSCWRCCAAAAKLRRIHECTGAPFRPLLQPLKAKFCQVSF